MFAQVVVCDGCCCGRISKGHNEVPIDALKSAWQENELDGKVELTISGCLGPCSMHNVAVLNADEDQTWVGKLSGKEHYDALVDWALEVVNNGVNVALPQLLATQVFEHNKPLVVRN